MPNSEQTSRIQALRRPWLAIILMVVGVVLIGVSAASYRYFRQLVISKQISDDQFVGVYAYDGRLIFAHNFQPDQRRESSKRRDFLLFSVSDYVIRHLGRSSGYVASRTYSTSGWFWGAVILAIGIRGYIKGWVIPKRRIRRDKCVVCGYDSRGNAGDACPECGAVVWVEKETACEDAGRHT